MNPNQANHKRQEKQNEHQKHPKRKYPINHQSTNNNNKAAPLADHKQTKDSGNNNPIALINKNRIKPIKQSTSTNAPSAKNHPNPADKSTTIHLHQKNNPPNNLILGTIKGRNNHQENHKRNKHRLLKKDQHPIRIPTTFDKN